MPDAERLEELLREYPDLNRIVEHPRDWDDLLELIWRPKPVKLEDDALRHPMESPSTGGSASDGFDPLETTLFQTIGQLDIVCSFITQEDGFKYVSPAFARLTGYTADEIFEMGPLANARLWCPEDHSYIARTTRARFLGKRPTELSTFRVLCKDGGIRYCLGSALGTKHDGRNALVAVCFDITERVQSQIRLRKAMEGSVSAMALTVETRDPYTAGHQRRVAELACAVAREMQLCQEAIEGIKMAGVIHDLGKLRVPPDILSKPGRLTEPEFAIIKTHPQVAHDILSVIDFPWPVSEIVYQHHERIDGSGYPQGLKDDEILIEARIIGVADVVEAMASHRPYRPALGIEKALEEIAAGKGSRYDPDVADACIRLFEQKAFSLADLDV